MQQDKEEPDPWDSEEAREALRDYLQVAWRIFERLNKEEVERMRRDLPPLED